MSKQADALIADALMSNLRELLLAAFAEVGAPGKIVDPVVDTLWPLDEVVA